MIKVGPAFSDSVAKDTRRRVRRGGFGNFSEVLNLIPLFLLVIVLATITIRLFYIQVLRFGYYKTLADRNRTKTEVIRAPRGVILDRDGKPLVANAAIYNLPKITNPKSEKDFETISQDQALKLISSGKKVSITTHREYLYKNAFAHVLGYVGKMTREESAMKEFDEYNIEDTIGKMGLEQQYEKILHGQNGKKLFEVDSKGKTIRELGSQEPVPGQNVKTTLSLDVQHSVSKAFLGVDRGAAVVSDPRDGSILALYSSPSFDPNVFISKDYTAEGSYTNVESILSDLERRPLLNRAISGAYPPGSTFKLIAATAALERGSIKPDTQIEDTGILKIGAFSFGNWYFLQYGRTEGNLNIVGAIKRSNDIFFYKAAEATGVDNISAWAKKFEFGSKLGIDLPGEVAGTVPTVEWKEKEIGEQWYLGDTYNYGIGQGYLLATPLQINTMTDVFANGGTLYQPHLVMKHEARIMNHEFINKKNLNLVRRGMAESCDTGGVAWPLFQFKVNNSKLKVDGNDFVRVASESAGIVRIKLACKTGTAEVGGDKKPDAWITVFAPFEKPEIAVTILVENGGEGSSVAGPIAKQILTDYFEKK